MFILLFIIPLAIWFGLAYYLDKKKIEFGGGNDYSGAFITNIICSIVLIIALFVVNFNIISSQKENYTKLEMLQENKMIYQKKADDLTVKFKQVLIDSYPNYEKALFDKMTPEDFRMLMVKYPEIKASLTSINFVDKLDALYKDIYDTDIQSREVVQKIRYNFINPWGINLFVPSVPENLNYIVYPRAM